VKTQPDSADRAAPAAAPSDAEPKPAESKPEAAAAEKSASAEKPSAPEPRAPQTQAQTPVPASDRVTLADTTARAVQQTAQQLPAAAIPQIAGEMVTRFRQGQSRFEIRLDPPELGRVDVRIEVDSDGRVHSRLMVEKSETLDLLKADQRALERALHEAGFKSDQNTLSFSLRDDRGGQNAKYEQHRFLHDMNVRTEPEDDPARLAAELAYRAPMRGPGGIDLRV
jgi:flagellar hook-length control protein FliK